MRNLRTGMGITRYVGVGTAEVGAGGGGGITGGYQIWWKHDEGSGAGIINHGTAQSANASFQGVPAALWTYNGPDGNPVGFYGGVAMIDYSSEIGYDTCIAGSANEASMSWNFAFYCTDVHAASVYGIFSKYDDASTGNWKFGITASKLMWSFIGAGSERRLALDKTIAVSTWYLVAFHCTFDDLVGVTNPQWYIWDTTSEAISAASQGWVGGIGPGANPTGQDDYIIIGSVDAGGGSTCQGEMFKGLLGDILIYNTFVASSDLENNMKALESRYF